MIILRLLLLMWPVALAAAPPVIIEESRGSYPLGLHLDIMEDRENRWAIGNLASAAETAPFEASRWAVPNFGISRSTYWLRFTVRWPAETTDQWFLELNYPHLDYVDLYLRQADGAYLRKPTGDHVPFHQRDISYPSFVFVLPPPPERVADYYLKITTTGTFTFPLTLWRAPRFAEKAAVERQILALYYGIMGGMLAYNLFLFLSVRDPSYFYYVVYIVLLVLAGLSYNGLAFQYLWPEAEWWAGRSWLVFASAMMIAAIRFTQTFLNTSKTTPRLHKLLWGLNFLLTLCLGLALVSYALTIHWLSFLGLVVAVCLMIVGGVCLVRGYRSARFFLLAWAALIVGGVVLVMKGFGWLPANWFTAYGFQIGAALEVVLLSLALGDRINLMKQQREEALRLQLAESQKVAALSETFKRFVPYEFLEILRRENITDIQLGDNVQRTMSVLFADIRSFTALSETMSPGENFAFINSFLSHMGPVIRDHRGFIDKYIGDAIMALFENADDAVEAGVAMLRKLDEYNQAHCKSKRPPVRIGIGINTGELMLGTIGEHGRMEGTVISDAVNLAARIENLTKQYGSSMLIGDATYRVLKHPERYAIRVIDRARVKGKTQAVTVLEVFEADPPALKNGKLAMIKTFEDAMSLFFAARFGEAIAGFQNCLVVNPDDLAAQLYVDRCKEFINAEKPEEMAYSVPCHSRDRSSDPSG